MAEEEVQKSNYAEGQNTRPIKAGARKAPPTTHNFKAVEGYDESSGYVPDVYIRVADNKFGGEPSLKFNIPEGKEVVLKAGTYYINPRKPKES